MNTRMVHVLFEIYYEEGLDLEKIFDDTTSFEELVASGISFTYAPYELAYAGSKGIVYSVEDLAGFGGDMEIDPEEENYEAKREKLIEKWQEIAVKKIDEEMKEYMAVKDSVLAEFDEEKS